MRFHLYTVLKKQHQTYLTVVIILPVIVSLTIISNLHARSSGDLHPSKQLWSERRDSAPVLAQVPNFSALAQRLIPTVVSIQVETKVASDRLSGMGGRRGGDPFYDYFNKLFGGQIPKEYRGRGLGTGFVIGKNGFILTNNHVIENAAKIEVTFSLPEGGERTLLAKVIGKAEEYDVALLKTEQAVELPIAYLGDSDKTRIGDWVMAVGNPFGLDHSVSVGIVSAKQRRNINPSNKRGLYDFIQTDASINPGNSGGPLINVKGEVIGINTAINAEGAGIGFAIPINMVKAMLPELARSGSFRKSWIGIRIQSLNPELAKSYGLKSSSGALVADVVPGSPAEKAGVENGDVVLFFARKPIRNSTDLPLYASMAGVGKRIRLDIWRDGKKEVLYITLGGFPTDEERLARSHGTDPNETNNGNKKRHGGPLGLDVENITPATQRRYGIPSRQGAMLTHTTPNGVAAKAGLVAGDIITQANRSLIKTAQDFQRIVKKTKSGSYIRLLVRRPGGKLWVAVRKP